MQPSPISRRTFLAGAAAGFGALGAGTATASPGIAGELQITCAGKPLFRYRFDGVPFKPYVRELFTPGGLQVLRDGAEHHPHHHALVLGLAANGVSYWAEFPDSGHQMHQRFEDIFAADCSGGANRAGFREQLAWRLPGEQPLLTEARRIEAYCNPPEPVSLLEWESVITPAGVVPVAFSGSHYYGLGMRFRECMDQGGQFLSGSGGEGAPVRGDEKLRGGAWCAYQAKCDGKPVTVAMMDHPSNPRPAAWFTMGDASPAFAFLAATMRLHEAPIEVGPGKGLDALRLCYGVAAWDGWVAPTAVEALAAWWRAGQEATSPGSQGCP